MARKYTEEQLLSLDKELLVTLFLGMQDQLDQMNKNLELLMEQVAIMNQRTFGRSSEKNLTEEDYSQAQLIEVNGEMILVFNEAESEYNALFNEPEEDEILEVCANKKRPKGKREQDLKGLPVVIESHELSDVQLKNIFGDMKYKRLPDEVYKRLVYKPATQTVVEHHVAVYAGDDNQTMVKADRPKDLIRGSIVTASLAAAILNGKYVNALPLYRMEQDFKRNGLNLSRQTMANWTIKLAEEYLSLFYDEMHKEIYKTHVLHADETPVYVSKDGRKTGAKSYMWVYRTGGFDKTNTVVLYDYQRTRKTDHPREFLKDFKGVLVTDGYQVYHTLEKEKDDFTVSGCWAHARRKFADVVKTYKNKDESKATIAYSILKRIQDIYRIEEGLSDLSSEERKQRRQDSVKPLVDALFSWLKEHQGDIGKEFATGKGISYCLNQEKYLREFLNDGAIPIDNNSAERAIRGFCIGKKNWVLIDTINGANASAIIYSIAETAKANHLRTYHYFKYLLTEIPKHMDDKNTDFLKDLLPWSPTLPDNLKF